MTFDEYEKIALKTADLKRQNELFHLVLGLSGEAGEISEKFKKWVRDDSAEESKINTQDIAKELGDLLWYITALANYLGVSLEEVAKLNNVKLMDRLDRNKLAGSGDNR